MNSQQGAWHLFRVTACYLCLLGGLIFGSSVHACFVPKKETKTSPANLVKRAKGIYLVRLKDSKGLENPTGHKSTEYTFEVLETIKGENIPELSLSGHEFSQAYEKDFNAHKAKDFWEPAGGRARVNPDCSVTGSFQSGQRYLIFPEESHLKAFERIDSDKDKWLKKVKAIASAKK